MQNIFHGKQHGPIKKKNLIRHFETFSSAFSRVKINKVSRCLDKACFLPGHFFLSESKCRRCVAQMVLPMIITVSSIEQLASLGPLCLRSMQDFVGKHRG